MSVRGVSYLILAGLAGLAVACGLGPALIAGLFSYTIIDAAHRRLAPRTGPFSARWLSLLAFAVAATLLAWLSARLLRQSLTAVPDLLDQALPRIDEIFLSRGIELPLGNTQELRSTAVGLLKGNFQDITHAGGLLTRRFLHIVIAIFVAVICFVSDNPGPYRANLYDSLRRELDERIWRFMHSFERVFGAQIIISGINTGFTAIYLMAMGFPRIAFLIPATFFLGMLPLIGNLLSNTLIVGTALTLSLRHAMFSLAFLVVIHKAEYFLNSKIVGSSIRAPMWQTLLSILIGEEIMGVPGIILAPAVMHYIREEIEANGRDWKKAPAT